MTPLIGLDLSCLEVEPETGVERYARRLAEHLPEVAPDLRLVALVRLGRPAPTVAPPGRVESVRTLLPRALWRETGLVAVAERLGLSLLHAPVAALPLRLRLPRVATIHDVDLSAGLSGRGRLGRNRLRLFHALRAADRIIVPSIATRDAVLRLRPDRASHVRVIPHGVDRDFRPEGLPLKRDRYGLPPRAPFLLWVGTVRPRKDPMVLIRAFARLAKQPDFRSLHLLMCGSLEMDEEELRAPLEGHEAQARFRLHGYAAREDLPDLYREAEAVVIPSQLEGFGLPALEAMACGAPLVVSTDPALREVAGSAALAFPTGDDEALAQTLTLLLRSATERDRLKELARSRATQFSWPGAARAHAAVYREVLALDPV